MYDRQKISFPIKKIGIPLLVIAVMLSMTSCSFLEPQMGQIVQSSESSLNLDVPQSWSKQELNDLASIEMGHLKKEQYLVVLEGQGFEEEYTLDEYVTLAVEEMLTMIPDNDGEPVVSDVTIGQGVAAKQFEMSGSVEKIKVTYLVTLAHVNGVYYEIIAWSLPSRYDAAKLVFDKILGSATF